ncbi:MAG: hypothetical protein HY000_41645 [Planctomycetes bacterium]|nr:hypothetical protein [Planctomycetota bacterium]
MQLDRTRIAIRERTFLDVLDLALRVIWGYWGPLAIASAAGAAPMILLNHWLLADVVEWHEEYGLDPDFWSSAVAYVMLQGILIYLEMPVATAPATLFLGQAMFLEKPSGWQIARDLFRSLPQLLLCQVLLRGLFVFLFITMIIPFAAWPYLNEIILLERNRLFRRSPSGTTTFRRSSNLHSSSTGDLFGRWLASLTIGLPLAGALFGSVAAIRAILIGVWRPDLILQIDFPVAAWTVVSFFTVVRFLSYLDLRIRNEGWEVELTMRAEAARLARQWT